MIQELLENNT